MAKIVDVIILVGGLGALWYAYKKGYLEDILGNLGGGSGGAIEPAPEAPAEEPKEEAPKEEKKKEDKKSTKKSKLALAFAGSHFDGEVLDTAYFVTTPSSFIPRRHENTIAMGVAIA